MIACFFFFSFLETKKKKSNTKSRNDVSNRLVDKYFSSLKKKSYIPTGHHSKKEEQLKNNSSSSTLPATNATITTRLVADEGLLGLGLFCLCACWPCAWFLQYDQVPACADGQVLLKRLRHELCELFARDRVISICSMFEAAEIHWYTSQLKKNGLSVEKLFSFYENSSLGWLYKKCSYQSVTGYVPILVMYTRS